MEAFLQGKRALITGGSQGIGFAITKALLAAGTGADVVICGRNRKALDRAVAELQSSAPARVVRGMVADVGRSEEVQRLFEFVDRELSGLDILINNAGSGHFAPTADLSIEDWDRQIATNLSGAFYCSREAIQRFRKQAKLPSAEGEKAGSWIINISSLAGKNPFAGGAAYNASKFGLNGFAEAMMLDHRNEDIRVSTILPGSVDTGFDGSDDSDGAHKSDWKVAPEDIAEIVLDILRKPARTLVSRVEVRPSRPKKST